MQERNAPICKACRNLSPPYRHPSSAAVSLRRRSSPSRWLALVGAAILPGTGQEPLLLLSKEADASGAYPVTLAGGGSDDGDGREGPVGFFPLFEERAIGARAGPSAPVSRVPGVRPFFLTA